LLAACCVDRTQRVHRMLARFERDRETAGVPPTQVAEWAGHSVMVLLRVYAKCIYGQEEMARSRIESALALPTTEVPDVAQTYRRITGEQP
ncbi:MAG TPA: hypothetical protein VFE92_05590, partial [Dermatophilaceae bacterium]|nr:hypothetical protein [Dermatophilaceae bacterium]